MKRWLVSISIYRCRAAAEVGRLAAEIIGRVVVENPRAVLGAATGSTPLPVYQALARQVGISNTYKKISVFALDEYVGLPHEHPQSYRSVILREVAGPLGLSSERVYVPDGAAADPHAEALKYENRLAHAGNADVQLLGVGSNGHLAFNEPGSLFTSRTRVVELAEQTRRDNARFFGGRLEAVPLQAITQGLATIMDSRKLVLLATGPTKARALANALKEKPTPELPASVIQNHPDVTVLVDTSAAKFL